MVLSVWQPWYLQILEALKILEQFIGSRCDAFKPELKQEQDDVYWSIHQPLKSFQLSSDATIFCC